MAKWVAVPISRPSRGRWVRKAGCRQRRVLANRGCIACSAASRSSSRPFQLGGSHLGGSLDGRLVGMLEGQQRLHVRQRLQLPVWSLKHRRLKLLYRTPLNGTGSSPRGSPSPLSPPAALPGQKAPLPRLRQPSRP